MPSGTWQCTQNSHVKSAGEQAESTSYRRKDTCTFKKHRLGAECVPKYA